MAETQQMRKTVDVLRELAEDWKMNIAVINDIAGREGTILESIKRVCKESNQGSMVKIGLTLLAFPLPIVIDDALGLTLLMGGLVQRKIKNSALYIEDVNKTFSSLIRELQEKTINAENRL